MISRRTFIKCAALSAAGMLWGRPSFAAAETRSLSLYNIHTDETCDVAYCIDGKYEYEALTEIHRLLRCHYTNQIRPIDTGVLDLLSDIRKRLAPEQTVEIISGYRSPEYNQYLRSIGRRVAEQSLHLQGLAIDFALPGISNSSVSRVARGYAAGGVGTYREFVHIDTGPVRIW